jgi:hypothetical protein
LTGHGRNGILSTGWGTKGKHQTINYIFKLCCRHGKPPAKKEYTQEKGKRSAEKSFRPKAKDEERGMFDQEKTEITNKKAESWN